MMLLALLPTAAFGQVLDLTVEPGPTGRFDIKLDGKPWLSGAETSVGAASASSGGLHAIGAPAASTGTDVLGSFKATTLKWAKKGSSAVLMEASFKEYPEDPGMIVFEQHFPTGLENENVPEWESRPHQWDVSGEKPVKLTAEQIYGEEKPPHRGPSTSAQTVFPGFARHGGVSHCFQYDNTFPTMHACELSTYKETHMGGVPLVMYDSANASLPMAVFSPLNQPMAHHMATVRRTTQPNVCPAPHQAKAAAARRAPPGSARASSRRWRPSQPAGRSRSSSPPAPGSTPA